MKKLLTIMLALMMVLGLAACASETAEPEVEENAEADVTVMSYEEFMAAEVGTECTIEAYVQDHQSWWDNAIKLYLQDKDGGYFAYEVTCSEEDAEKLVPGTLIRVSGVKSDYKGEIELYEDDLGNKPTFEFVEGGDTYIAEATDVTEKVGTDELVNDINKYVVFSGVTVKEVLYNWDGTGSNGDDLYVTVVCPNGEELSITVPRYLRGADTDTYKTVEGLVAGDVIDAYGFLYYYDTANPHITDVTVK